MTKRTMHQSQPSNTYSSCTSTPEECDKRYIRWRWVALGAGALLLTAFGAGAWVNSVNTTMMVHEKRIASIEEVKELFTGIDKKLTILVERTEQ